MKTLKAGELEKYLGNQNLVCEKVNFFKYQIRCMDDNKILATGYTLRNYVSGIIKVMYTGDSRRNYKSLILESDVYKGIFTGGSQHCICEICK